MIYRPFILIVLLVSSLQVHANKGRFHLSKKVLKNSDTNFISHQGPGRFDSYLSMEVHFEPVADLFKQILIERRSATTSRGEAHITVITPIEYFDGLASKISMLEIDKLATDLKIQSAKFKIICLGRGELSIDSKLEHTYYVVVESEDLLKIRRRIQQLFIEKGGDASLFNPEKFYPHITVGFSKRDLHESDGVIKNQQSCWADLVQIP